MLLRIATFTLVSLFLSACARSPVVQLYDGPARSDSSIVTVRVPSELEVFTINGEEVEGVNTFFSTEYKDLKVAPGRYEILAYYKELWQLDADNHEIVKTNPANFVVDGKPGEIWVLGFDKPQDVEAARAMEDNFHGWAENPASGQKVAAEKSKLVLKRGFMAPITGEEVTTPTTNSVAPLVTGAAAAAPAAQAAQATYLDTLKAQWNQATPEERREFLQWISQ
ncbi:MAG: DUF2057 domain-containing protein [Pseudomonadales bacterium]|nr:DUF2057 domain-containing protein [Pseudomonadales bacterium]